MSTRPGQLGNGEHPGIAFPVGSQGVDARVRGLGPAPTVGSLPENPTSGPPMRLPGWVFPQADSIPVDSIEKADISDGTSAAIVTILVPNNRTLRVNGIGFGANDPAGLAFVSWSVFTDPPVAPFNPYIDKPASIGSIEYPSDVIIIVGSSVTLTLVLSNTSATTATYRYYARVRGWFYVEEATT